MNRPSPSSPPENPNAAAGASVVVGIVEQDVSNILGTAGQNARPAEERADDPVFLIGAGRKDIERVDAVSPHHRPVRCRLRQRLHQLEHGGRRQFVAWHDQSLLNLLPDGRRPQPPRSWQR